MRHDFADCLTQPRFIRGSDMKFFTNFLNDFSTFRYFHKRHLYPLLPSFHNIQARNHQHNVSEVANFLLKVFRSSGKIIDDNPNLYLALTFKIFLISHSIINYHKDFVKLELLTDLSVTFTKIRHS